MKRKMSETRAWAWLAPKWDKAVESGGFANIFLSSDYQPCGLCPCIDWLCDEERISEETAESMREKIPKKQAGIFTMNYFRWPPTMAGAKQRAAFCRKMAAKTKVKR